MNKIIDYCNTTENETFDGFESSIDTLFQYALQFLNIETQYEVSVSIIDEVAIREMNRDYRDKDSVTDVISFAFLDAEEQIIFPNGVATPLGDIYICDKRAIDQAIEYGHSLKREVHFLALHGLLHLLGYDHMTEEEDLQMRKIQSEILSTQGYERE